VIGEGDEAEVEQVDRLGDRRQREVLIVQRVGGDLPTFTRVPPGTAEKVPASGSCT